MLQISIVAKPFKSLITSMSPLATSTPSNHTLTSVTSKGATPSVSAAFQGKSVLTPKLLNAVELSTAKSTSADTFYVPAPSIATSTYVASST